MKRGVRSVNSEAEQEQLIAVVAGRVGNVKVLE
jgi:hypothetical protein